MYADLKGKTVVVTGAADGLGKATGQAFAQAGAKVIVLARKNPRWVEEPGYERVRWLNCDIEDRARFAQWLTTMEQDQERIDILVNNAGVLRVGPLLDCDEAEFDQVMGANVKATFFLSQTVARHMATVGGGVILNAASYAATLPSHSHGLYAASKAAICSLTRSMAAEWAPWGIRVNAYSPGVIPTRMTQPAIDQAEARMLENISLGRFGAPSEVAAAVLFLASDVSSYITGVNLDVSGGKFLIQNAAASWVEKTQGHAAGAHEPP